MSSIAPPRPPPATQLSALWGATVALKMGDGRVYFQILLYGVTLGCCVLPPEFTAPCNHALHVAFCFQAPVSAALVGSERPRHKAEDTTVTLVGVSHLWLHLCAYSLF